MTHATHARASLGWVAVFLGGCLFPLGEEQVIPDTNEPPEIVEIETLCDPDIGRWRFEVTTDAWSGGGDLFLTEDGEYIEEHKTLRSVRAEGDGSGDLLRAELVIIDDFRQGGGGSTVFGCGASLYGWVLVVDLFGELSDCLPAGEWPEGIDPEALECGEFPEASLAEE